MKKINKKLQFFLDFTRINALIARTFDRSLGGLGFNFFLILYYLSQEPEERMKRIDLADKVALSASGVTRIILPMEKIGLVTKEESKTDARVSYVKLAPGGKRLLAEALEEAEYLSEELLATTKLESNEVFEIFSAFNLKKLLL